MKLTIKLSWESENKQLLAPRQQKEMLVLVLTFDTFLTSWVIQFPNCCRLEAINWKGKSKLLLAGTWSAERSDKGQPDSEGEETTKSRQTLHPELTAESQGTRANSYYTPQK